jgi:hypothetical protein
MGHFKTLYIKENTTLDDLLNKHKDLSNYLDLEFARKYCDCCGEENPTIQDICDYCGLIGNTFNATTGVKSKYGKQEDDSYMIVNLQDMKDEYLDIIHDRVWSIATNKKVGRKTQDYYTERQSEVAEYLDRIKKREIKGVAVLIDCHW